MAALLSVFLSAPLSAQDRDPAVLPGSVPVAEARDGFVILTPQTTLPLAFGNRRIPWINIPESVADRPVLGPDKTGPAHQLLRRLVNTGRAAGNAGDLYDNRDRGHARLDPLSFPQLTHIRYGPVFRAEGLDYGLPLTLLYDHPVIGNSSTALTRGALWRSQSRLAMTGEGGAWMQRLYRNYRSGQIDVFPEHRDHESARGDLFPANTPYLLTSQGSSGSDLPHVEALVMILAALRPDTKARLMEEGLLAPMVQMVYRRARIPVRSRADYLSGAAHPSAFRAADISLARMVSLANAILPDEIPPMVELTVLEDLRAVPGQDFFGDGLGERLFDTPSAIARIWRSRAGQRQMRISAAGTRDPNGRDLRFDWVLLRGDPDKVRIEPEGEGGHTARIHVDWQEPQAVPGREDLTSSRIDIGVFAHNGLYDSAPAFVSILLPGHEIRRYDADLRVLSIDRAGKPAMYADPLIFPVMDWRDVYLRDADGAPAGWIRHRDTGQEVFDARGRRLSSTDGQAVRVTYPVETIAGGRTRITEDPPPETP
ncbi:MAG: hypothetical protein ACWA5A_16320 [Marinibacterium sp.]